MQAGNAMPADLRLIETNSFGGAAPVRAADSFVLCGDDGVTVKGRQASDIRIALCGDVMLGRGIDQVLPHPGEPKLYERYVPSALDYVALAERANGPIRRPVSYSYVWGAALPAMRQLRPDLRIVNLETAVTRGGHPSPKGINYRMHPGNLPCLKAFGIDCCVLANNHVLDWGTDGLLETLDVLGAAGMRIAGAGRTEAEGWAPAVFTLPDKGRVLVFAVALPSSGVPRQWAAAAGRPGVAFINDASPQNTAVVAAHIDRHRQEDDVVIVSLHWGANWGYEVSPQERAFAQSLIAEARADIVHGHSSHHPKGIEIHRGRPILYGCGDFLNDYEGISGYESYRGDLSMLYLVTLSRSDRACRSVEMLPFRIRRFRLETATAEEADWLQQRMDRECRRFGGCVDLRDGCLVLSWQFEALRPV
jgi:poly-gamma-glutamate capsule biosynthesis protein CapA/YwtB (metallophosphatase superfamily)